MADTIQEYLVRLGYQVDQSQQNRFADGLKATHLQMSNLEKVVSKSIAGFYELATAAGGTAIAIATALGKIAMGMAGMSFQAQRVGASVANIHALGFAFTQAGGSAEDANAALETYAENLRMIPGFEQQVKTMYNVTATDKAEQLQQIAAEMQKRIAASGPEGSIERATAITRELQRAESILHIGRQQALLMQRPEFNPAYNQAKGTEQRINVDWDKAAKQGEEYRKKLNEIRDEFVNLKTFVYGEFANGMNEGLGKVSGYLKEHDRDISEYIRNTRINFEGMTKAVSDWYKSLNEEQQGQVKTAAVVGGGGALLAGGGALLAGIATKLGIPGAAQVLRLGALSAAIIALTNDYETWKKTEGKGSSGLIDWEKWEGPINKTIALIKELNEDWINPLAAKLGISDTFVPAFEGLIGFLIGSKFLGVLKTSGLWAFFTFLRSPLSWLTLLKGDAGPLSEEDQKKLEERNRQEAEDYQREHPGWKPGEPREPAPSGGMLNNFFRRLFGGGETPVGDRIRAGGGAGPAPSSQESQEFYDKTYNDLRTEAERRNLPHPEVIAALGASQASHESASGTSDLARRANNLFGIKPGTPGGVGESGQSGDYVAFKSREDSAKGYLDFITKNPRYADVLNAPNVADAASRMARTGYAEDPNYLRGVQNQYLRHGVSPVGNMVNRLKELGVNAPPPSGMTTPPPPSPASVPASSSVSFNSNPIITVNGVSDPQLAANYVERASQRQNADVLRRLQPVYA